MKLHASSVANAALNARVIGSNCAEVSTRCADANCTVNQPEFNRPSSRRVFGLLFGIDAHRFLATFNDITVYNDLVNAVEARQVKH